jgi:Na+/H+ antiporter NhaD/arsenite permease-like protein
MEPASWITLALVGIAAVLFVTERLRPISPPPDLIVLSLTGIVTPEQAFAGFSQSAVITILAMFILTFALEQTGVTHWLGMRLLRSVGERETRLATALMLTAAFLSLFMNSIAAAAVLLPSAVAIARQTNRDPRGCSCRWPGASRGDGDLAYDGQHPGQHPSRAASNPMGCSSSCRPASDRRRRWLVMA